MFPQENENDDPTARPDRKREIEFGARYESVVDKIVDAKTEEDRRYWTYWCLERIVNYNDDWTARINREELAKRVAAQAPERIALQNRDFDSDSEEGKKQTSLHNMLTLIQDVDKLFDQWFAFYKKMAPGGKIYQMAFHELPEYMPPEYFKRVYGEMPGFVDGDREWLPVYTQIDKAARAFIYLALQSDPRWDYEFNWYRNGAGLDNLFENESTELDWVRRLKLKTLPNEKNDLAYLRGCALEELILNDIKKLDSVRAFNRFADANTGATVKATLDAIQELVAGEKYKDNPAMQMQARIAVAFAEKTMRFFGIAAMYGTRGTAFKKSDSGGDLIATKVNAEDYPWSDAWTDLTRPRDNITYNQQNSYFAGPLAWQWFAPEHVIVDFLKMMPVSDAEFPESSERTRSAWELFRNGKTIGEIMSDEAHIGDWSYRAFLIRGLFALREDSGAYLAMNGELTRGKNFENVSDDKFWEDVEKSIHIVCRKWIVTKGNFEKWFLDHSSEIDKYASKHKVDRLKAADEVLDRHVKMEKNKWKAVAWLGAMQFADKYEKKGAIIVAKKVGYLDSRVLDLTEGVDYRNSAAGRESMRRFIEAAMGSVT